MCIRDRHRAVLVIFPLNLQTNITAQILYVGEAGAVILNTVSGVDHTAKTTAPSLIL